MSTSPDYDVHGGLLRVICTGLLECDCCGTLWLFTCDIAEVESIDRRRCRRCRASMLVLLSSVIACAVPSLPPAQSFPGQVPMIDKAAVIERVLEREGPWSESEAAKGRPTNWGWKLDTFQRVTNNPGATVDDLKALTREAAGELHWQEFFIRTRIAGIPNAALAECVADMAVNSGPSRAIEALQRALGFTGAAVDGVLGTVTMHSIPIDGAKLARIFLAERMEFLGRWAAGDLTDADHDGRPDRLEDLPGILNRVGQQMRSIA